MFLLYSIIFSLAFVLMLPLFLVRREKYASGFSQRLGNYPEFKHDDRKVIWLHCVSVGETNAARPLVEKLVDKFPDHRLVISTTTRTGQELARKIFAEEADAIFYFPFDFKFSVRRALEHFKPSLALLMETEIWPRFIHETKLAGAKVVIVNGRLSQKSLDRYTRVRSFIATVLKDVDLALMQDDADAKRIVELGIDRDKVIVTGNLKFEQTLDGSEITEMFRRRFGIDKEKLLVIAASTHEPEERAVIQALSEELSATCRLMIAPRHPERFEEVAALLTTLTYRFVRRSAEPSAVDRTAEIILLDSIGELRVAYPLAEIVFVGGSLIPHGGQSILEPAAAAKAIVTGPHTHNFDAVIEEFLEHDAVIQLRGGGTQTHEELRDTFTVLLANTVRRRELGQNAAALMKLKGGAADKTIDLIRTVVPSEKS